MFGSRLIDGWHAHAREQRSHLLIGERGLKIPRQAGRRIHAHGRALLNDLIFHGPETFEPFFGFRDRAIEKLIVVALRFLQQARAGLKPVEIDTEPLPLFGPTAFFRIERKTRNACLVTVRIPVDAVIAANPPAAFGRAFIAHPVGSWQ